MLAVSFGILFRQAGIAEGNGLTNPGNVTQRLGEIMISAGCVAGIRLLARRPKARPVRVAMPIYHAVVLGDASGYHPQPGAVSALEGGLLV